MTYDTKSVLERYQQLQSLPEGEPTDSACPLLSEDGTTTDANCSLDGCRSCCMGVVEVVRQVHARQVAIEKETVTFDDMLTKANKLQSG